MVIIKIMGSGKYSWDVEKFKPFCIAAGNIKWHSCCSKALVVLQKDHQKLTNYSIEKIMRYKNTSISKDKIQNTVSKLWNHRMLIHG
jgi:flavodoxin